MKWEKPQDGTYRLILYKGGKQSTLLLTEKELLGCASKGWEEWFQEKIEVVLDE